MVLTNQNDNKTIDVVFLSIIFILLRFEIRAIEPRFVEINAARLLKK